MAKDSGLIIKVNNVQDLGRIGLAWFLDWGAPNGVCGELAMTFNRRRYTVVLHNALFYKRGGVDGSNGAGVESWEPGSR